MGPQIPSLDPDLLAALVEQAPASIILADRDGQIRFWNRESESLFGFPAEEVMGRSLDVIIPEHLRRSHWDGYERSLATGESKYAGRVMTTRAVHRDGRKLYVEFSFSLLRDASGAITGAIAVGRDATERFLAERARHMEQAAG